MIRTKHRFGTLSLESASGVLWFLLILLLSGSPYQTLPSLRPLMDLLRYIGGSLAALSLILHGTTRLNPQTKFFLASVVMIFSTAIGHLEITSQFYWKQFCVILIAFSVAKRYGLQKIVRSFVSAMFIISVLSIVGYILLNTTSLLDSLPHAVNVNYKEYAIGVFFNYLIDIPQRNCGIFWEPGIFATYLILALSLEIIYPSSAAKHYWRYVVFFAAIVTTTSTAGYAMFLACVFLFFVRITERSEAPLLIRFFPTLAFILALFFVLNLDTIIQASPLVNYHIFEKLLSDNLVDASRILVVPHNIQLFLREPIFGAGIKTVSDNLIPNADVSSITYMMSIFGLLGLVLPIGFFRGIFFRKEIGFYAKLTLFAIIIAILSKEPHHNMPFTWCLFFAFLEQENCPTRRST